MGLGLGAETPEEIAVSIMAEVLMLRNNGSGRPMQKPK
jgi:xanthine dehydrogenase accessory factor